MFLFTPLVSRLLKKEPRTVVPRCPQGMGSRPTAGRVLRMLKPRVGGAAPARHLHVTCASPARNPLRHLQCPTQCERGCIRVAVPAACPRSSDKKREAVRGPQRRGHRRPTARAAGRQLVARFAVAVAVGSARARCFAATGAGPRPARGAPRTTAAFVALLQVWPGAPFGSASVIVSQDTARAWPTALDARWRLWTRDPRGPSESQPLVSGLFRKYY